MINKPLEYWIQESGDHAIWFNFKAKPPNKIFIGKKADLGEDIGIIYSSERVACPSEAKKWSSDNGELKNFTITYQGISENLKTLDSKKKRCRGILYFKAFKIF